MTQSSENPGSQPITIHQELDPDVFASASSPFQVASVMDKGRAGTLPSLHGVVMTFQNLPVGVFHIPWGVNSVECKGLSRNMHVWRWFKSTLCLLHKENRFPQCLDGSCWQNLMQIPVDF